MIGKQLQNYSVLEKIGEGGMGEVYLAHDRKLDRDVALKILPDELASQDERLRRFQREARTIASLNHPNIVTIFAVEEVEGIHFLAMELVEGESLEELIPSTGMALEDFFLCAIPTIEALSAAHEQGITHRDIKPGNVMISTSDRVKVLDFGLAKLDSGFGRNIEASTQTLTEEGSIIGTVPYMAPEQFTGKPLDARTDIFSLGVLFHQMLTGSRPFQGDSSAELISSILRDKPEPVSEIRATLPNHLGRIVRRCLEKDPERRYQSVIDLRNSLEGLKEEIDSDIMHLPASALPIDTPSEVSSSGGWGRMAAIAGGAIALLLLVTLGLMRLAGGAPATEPEPPIVERTTTVAVLPLKELGSATDGTFSMALTDEVANRLTSLPGLLVVSQSTVAQSARSGATAKEIGELVGADYILDGSLFWSEVEDEEKVLRFTERLIRVEDDIQVLFHDQLSEFLHPLALQSEFAIEVAELIGSELLDLPGYELAALFPQHPVAAGDSIDEKPQEPVVPAQRAPRKTAPARAPPELISTASEQEPPTEFVNAPVTAEPGPTDLTAAEPSASQTVAIDVTLETALEQGILTVYADDETVYRRPFRAKRRDQQLADTETVELPRSATQLRVYAAPAGEPAKLARVEIDLQDGRGGSLEIKVTKRGEVRAKFRR